MLYNIDVAIIGGNILGLALACGLQGSNLRVALLENNELSGQIISNISSKIHFLVINTASKKLLNYLGVWSEIITNNISSYNGIEIWDKDSFGHITFNNADTAYDNLGYVIKNDIIYNALWKQIQKYKDIVIITSTKIQQVIRNKDDVYIILQNGDMLVTYLLVGTDSANSWLRNEKSISFSFCEYRHHTLTAIVRTAEAHNAIARQIFYKSGILIFLPLNDPHLCSIIWSLCSDDAQRMLKVSHEMFNQNLCITSDNRLGLCNLESDRQIFPIVEHYIRRPVSHRLVLIGDVAYTTHLLAGQGVNIGFMDIAKLIDELRSLYRAGKDIGHYYHLKKYERNRKYHIAMMLYRVHIIYEIFSGSSLIKKLLRNLGIRFIDILPEVKLYLINKAMGLNDLPEWLI